MNIKKLHLGLIGKDVSKSDSPRIHTFILKEWGIDCEYDLLSVSPDGFDLAMRRLMGDFDAFNVTIPYKRDVMEYLNEVNGDAFLFSAVNTVVSATAAGYNTDGAGFMLMLRANGIDVSDKKILVLGMGGSGRSTAAVLKQNGAKVYAYQRRQEKLQETCNEIGVTAVSTPYGAYDILVNCTGVGMHKTEGVSPVEALAFNSASVAIDLIYRPEKSEFLRLAEERGLKICNGKAMLFFQAYYADCIYVNKQPDDGEAQALYEKFNQQ